MKGLKIQLKTILASALLILGAASPVFSQSQQFTLKDLTGTMDVFSEKLAKSLPFNASMGLNWADAYIGSFPHFGVGISGGFTTMQDDSLGNVMDMFVPGLSDNLLSLAGFPMPGLMIEGRIGGIKFFDVGVKVGYLPTKPKQFDKMTYFLIGGDVRFALLKEKLVTPDLSLGVGYNYMRGSIGKNIGSEIKIDYQDASNVTQTITLSPPELGINWSTSVIDLKAQISKTFAIVTPYLGVGGSYGMSKAGYSLDTKIDAADIAAAKEIFKAAGIDITDGLSSETPIDGWSFRTYGGLSLNLLILRLDLTGLYNFLDNNWGLTLGIRLEISGKK